MGSLNTGVGIIATLVRDGEVIVRHFAVEPEQQKRDRGHPRPAAGTEDAVDALVAFCDAGGWLVRSVSSPASVLRDLLGRGGTDQLGRAIGVQPPETQMLHARHDLLEKRPVRTMVERDAPGRQRRNGHA